MLLFKKFLVTITIALTIQSGVAIASDDNPWSMDDSGEKQQPYYNLNGHRAGGFFDRDQQTKEQAQPRALPNGKRLNESEMTKSFSSDERLGWQGAPGKSDRDEVYGYAGPQSQASGANQAPADRSRFGAFPPTSGAGRVKREFGTSARISSGVQFGGKTFGAFPPLEQRAQESQRQSSQNVQQDVQRVQRRGASAFANVPPPPVPEPVPTRRILPYPYIGSGVFPGYGTRYGTGYGLTPGLGVPGISGPTGLGPTFLNPGLSPGVLGPGLLW